MSQHPATAGGEPPFGHLDESSSPETDETEGSSGPLTIARKPQPSTRISLFIESLIKSYISGYQLDDQKANHAYNKICRRLNQMGFIDESWKMTELEGARMQFGDALGQLLNGAPTRTSSPIFPQGSFYRSRYAREFNEQEKIGGGAFGKVFKVKNKLDGIDYAVKKIPIFSQGIRSIKTCISEVKTFASLNHPNIVQYKGAWLELAIPMELEAPQLTETNDNLVYKKSCLSYYSRQQDSSKFEIVFERSKNCDKSDSSSSSSIEASPQNAVVPKQINGTKPKLKKACWAILYIQMTLCHGTLQQWVRGRNDSLAVVPTAGDCLKTKVIQEILLQIVRGLQYIHSKGVVHHDIKPSNIFISAEAGSLLVQLGDFGLACPLQLSRHKFARGTPLYAAPEQLAGRCDPKSDLYSVGIVLYEMQAHFGTDMERTKRLTELRARNDPKVPRELRLENLVDALVRRRPSERPDASTLLRTLEGGVMTKAEVVEVLQKKLEDKDREIERLKGMLEKLGVDVDGE